MSRISKENLVGRLKNEIVIGDGAMGTQLYNRGVSLDANFEHLNLVRPDLVSGVHADYVEAGAQLIETNSFAANRVRLGAIGLADKVNRINLAAANLARQAAGADILVAGSVGPLVRARGDESELDEALKREIFLEQMSALADGGVDLFQLETFAELKDLELALAVADQVGLPAIAQFALLEGGRTRDGFAAEEAARRLEGAGAVMVGANCGAGPRELLQVIRRMASATDLPLSAFPNSGFPELVDGRSIYLSTPEYFASRALEMVAAGATLLGGCCGTGPEHIAALAETLREAAPAQRSAAVSRPPETVAVEEVSAPVAKSWLENDAVLVTVELDPPRGINCDKIIAGARQLAAAGVSAISIADNPLARVRLGNIALANRIQQEADVEVIVHMTGRDRNLIGLHSDLMGAHLLGIRNILAVTGDPVSLSGEVGATSVFDVNSIGLLELLSVLNRGETLYGQELGEPTRFLLGAAFNPNADRIDGQVRKLVRKTEAGAQFVQTQPVYSVEVMERMLSAVDSDIPLLLGILPLVSERNAEFLHNEVPGIQLPEDVRRRMRGKGGAAGVKEGMAIAREIIDAGRGRVGGFYLMPPFGKVDLALELLTWIRKG
jgi:homocysteine S-methyltransferase